MNGIAYVILNSNLTWLDVVHAAGVPEQQVLRLRPASGAACRALLLRALVQPGEGGGAQVGSEGPAAHPCLSSSLPPLCCRSALWATATPSAPSAHPTSAACSTSAATWRPPQRSRWVPSSPPSASSVPVAPPIALPPPSLPQDRFFTELREHGDGFTVVAEHFGRGIMNLTAAATRQD